MYDIVLYKYHMLYFFDIGYGFIQL
jgi:hypothetical protein